jgi:lipoprotein-anchoring transpeptidase ErfK/SrfK
MRRSSTSVAACAVAATVLAAFAAEFPSPARATTVSRLYVTGSDIATPRGPLLLHAAPNSERIVAQVGSRSVFGSPTSLAVVGESDDWLAVISEQLGNRVRGFVRRARVRITHDPYSLEVDRPARTLTVWRLGIRLRRIAIAVGATETPTPRGRFAITDKLRDFWSAYYGCCVLALSGRQERTTSGWAGGNRLAIHAGTGIGLAVSNGCLRAATQDMEYLMRLLPLGTQLIVHD